MNQMENIFMWVICGKKFRVPSRFLDGNYIVYEGLEIVKERHYNLISRFAYDILHYG